MIYQPNKVQDPKPACFKKDILKISYIKSKENYLIVTEEGKTFKLEGEENFNNFVEDNNCKII